MALYGLGCQNSLALSTVNEIELLTNILSGKILQKLALLDAEESRRGV